MKVTNSGTFIILPLDGKLHMHWANWSFELEPGDVVTVPEETRRAQARLVLLHIAESCGIDLVPRPPPNPYAPVFTLLKNPLPGPPPAAPQAGDTDEVTP